MEKATSFLKGGFSDPSESPEAYLLRTFKGQIESICNLLDFDTSLQRVKSHDIGEWDTELRAILKGIKRLRNTSYIDSLLDSSDAVQNWIAKALDHFYVASDILQKKGIITIREREKFYEKLRASSHCLAKALEYFLV
jgi:hypothetical protein